MGVFRAIQGVGRADVVSSGKARSMVLFDIKIWLNVTKLHV